MAQRTKNVSHPPSDPHSAREQDRYAHPIPSRELILSLLEAADAPQSFKDIAGQLALTDERDLDALGKRLRAMQRDGQIISGRRGAYGLPKRMDLLRCRVTGHRDGFGFARPLEGGDDLFLSAREMYQVFDGDEVLVSVAGLDRRGRAEGQVVEVLTRAHTEVVGRYMEESGIGFLLPHNTRIRNHILIPPKAKEGARHGQLVSVKLTDYPSATLGAKGEVIEVLGDHLDPGLEIDVAIRAHGIPWEWPGEVLREAGALGEEPAEADNAHRVDLRDVPFVPIDGEDARDFDDAVWCEENAKGSQLRVAIADVSHYVPVGSALDEEASIRGNSVYFPERVVPMFPEVLSNGLCSLKPQVDRLAMVCEMQIDHSGHLQDYIFYEAVIHSHARLTYTDVGEVIEEGWSARVPAERGEDIERLCRLYNVLRGAREQRGALDFESQETRILFDEQRKIASIKPAQRNDAHKLIEECMLVANVATAQFLEALEKPALFRVHEGPGAEKLENLRAFLGELSLDLAGGLKPTPEHYQALLATVEGRDDCHIIQTMLLRSLSQAVYQPENAGHFGLHYEAYAHFTSPIRRYPDLLVHRAIRAAIRVRGKANHIKRVKGATALKRERIYPYDTAAMAALGEHCSMTERRADDATREVDAWLKCEFLRDRIGEEFEGVIAAVTTFGVFVELSDLYIEGLMHVSALPGDYYHFDQAKQRLIGERTRQVFQLGGTVAVRIARVDLDDRKIDLEPAGLAPSRRGKIPQRKPKDDAIRSRQRGKKDRRGDQGSDEQHGGRRKTKGLKAKISRPSAKAESARTTKSGTAGKSAKKTKANKGAGSRSRSSGSAGKKRR
ncbi:MAG: ribonuclease R [Pseudomonadota bacterium]|nr:ribonuclease R [Pseudomonadota bacterium]